MISLFLINDPDHEGPDQRTPGQRTAISGHSIVITHVSVSCLSSPIVTARTNRLNVTTWVSAGMLMCMSSKVAQSRHSICACELQSVNAVALTRGDLEQVLSFSGRHRQAYTFRGSTGQSARVLALGSSKAI